MNTIRSRVLTALILTAIMPLAALFFLSDSVIGSAVRKSEKEKLTKINRELSAYIAVLMEGAVNDLAYLQTNPILIDPSESKERRDAEMQRLVEVFDFFSDISIYDNSGFLISSTADDLPSYRDYTLWFEKARNGQVSVSNPLLDLGEKNRLKLHAYLPVFGEDGQVISVIQARMNFEQVVHLLSEVRPGAGGKIVLLDELGNILSGDGDNAVFAKFDKGKKPEDWVREPTGIYTDRSGERFLYSAAVLPAEKTHVKAAWTLIALLPESEVEAVTSAPQKLHALATVVTLAIALLIGVFVSDRLTRPLRLFRESARKVAAGDLTTTVDGAGSRELIDLGDSFNGMVDELRSHRDGLEKLVLSRTDSLRRSQSELEQANARLQSSIDSANNGFLVEDVEGGIALVSRLFRTHIGGEEQIISIDDFLKVIREHGEIAKGDLEEWAERRESGEVIDDEVFLSGAENRVLHIFSAPIRGRRGHLVGRVWNTQDLTEQRHLEESLRQSQKMEAVGQLAGGVAHDFNNLLTGILGNLSLLSIDLRAKHAGPDKLEKLNLAIKASERAADLVKQLLGFSRRSQMNLKACDTNLVLREVRGILAATVDRRIGIELDLEEAPWRVMADVGMLSQVIMNMAVNAKDAMPEGGVLKLSSTNQKLEAGDLKQQIEAKPGEYIRLSVEDNGEGIPLDVQKRVFEPFFTTKEPGKGTGLGLATSFGIAKQLGGWIEMDSTEGEGTRFDIYLPRSAAAEAQPDPPSVSEQIAEFEKPSRSKSAATILIIDDEDMVRMVARTLLIKLGYSVIEACDGVEGLSRYEEHRDEIDLVLLDLTMPNLSGKDTFRRLRELDQSISVLICSGYLVDVNEFSEECGACPDGFIQKPYRFEDMSDIVRETIDGRSAAA